MNRATRLTRLVGFAIVASTIIVAAAGYFVVRRDVDALRESGRENILWSAVQVEIELMRLQRSLADFARENGATTRDVNDRFDILWSRVLLFRQGTVGARLTQYDTPGQTVAKLFGKMQEVEDIVVGLKPGDYDTAVRLNRIFDGFANELRVLSRDVLHGEEANNADLREGLSQSSSALTVISAIAVLASVLVVFIFARETQRFRALAEQNRLLLVDSDRASRAKSQFLAMMSHELRTPMNGVLGLLALIRRKGLSQQQERLLDQADRSGKQMNALLADILDFSALQDDLLKLDNKPFEPRRLTSAVRDLFEPVALREGTAFAASTDASCPEQVLGDFARLRQALTHLATYVLETAGTRDIALDLSYSDGRLRAAISFVYSKSGGEWHPELILGAPDRSGKTFASEALGPAVSRGLIERMGGSTMLANPTPDRIAVLVEVPAEELICETVLIQVVTQSGALEAICKAALRSERIRFLSEGDTAQPHVVMLEAGGAQESADVAALSARYPNALMVALGRPVNPHDFQDVVEVPINLAKVREAAFMRLAIQETTLDDAPELRYAGRENNL